MKKLLVIALFILMTIGIALGGGDQNQGDTGSGSTSTGEGSNGQASQDRSGR